MLNNYLLSMFWVKLIYKIKFIGCYVMYLYKYWKITVGVIYVKRCIFYNKLIIFKSYYEKKLFIYYYKFIILFKLKDYYFLVERRYKNWCGWVLIQISVLIFRDFY